mgnify:FL=1
MIPKFRAWLKEENKMIIVDTMNWFDDEFESIEDGITFLRGAEKIELMQSTGLKDKNGKEVFLGDIIKCTRGCPHEVYLEKEYGGIYVGGMPAIYLKGIREGYAWTGEEEILGNIYENPELLEVE